MHPELGNLLDSGEIDYAVLDVLEQILRKKKLLLYIDTEYAMQIFMKMPIIRALLDLNIMYKSKYFALMYVEHWLYISVI